MKTKVNNTVTISIELNIEEAGFLKDQIQNIKNPYSENSDWSQEYDIFFKGLFQDLHNFF